MYHHKKKYMYEAVLRNGKESEIENSETGDALLVYPEKCFFAVADSPAHHPEASGQFLAKIKRLVDTFDFRIYNNEQSMHGFQSDVEDIENHINKLIKTIDFNDRTTFTGIFIFPGIKKALLLHNGDSLLYHFHLNRGKIDIVSETNHCLVGKYPKLYQAKLFSYTHYSRLLLVTDGFSDILRPIRTMCPYPVHMELMRVLKNGPVDTFITDLLKFYDVSKTIKDDLGIIIIDPNTLMPEMNCTQLAGSALTWIT